MREQNKIRTQHTRDRATGTDHRHLTGWQYIGLQKSRRGSAEYIKDQVRHSAEMRFHIIAEDEQHPHVAQNMKPASMQKHGRENGDPCMRWVMQEKSGNQAPCKNEAPQCVRTHLQFI